MSDTPILQYYATAGLPEEQAFELWRSLMAPMYHVDRATPQSPLPRGEITAYLLGDLIANRTRFSPQHVTRDKRRVESTPDHLIVQFWRVGGSRGEVGGRPSHLAPGHVALADRRRKVDAYIAASDTYGFVLPRSRLVGIDLEAHGLRLDAGRNRLLAARVKTLYRQLPHIGAAEAPALADELVAYLRRLLDPSTASDVLEGAELDAGLFALAEAAIRADLGAQHTPQSLSERLGISRATLFRTFAPVGGVINFLQEVRLLTLAAALSDPLETRSLTRLAAEHGFTSLAHFSRSFRGRFGLSAREWRAHKARQVHTVMPESMDSGSRAWNSLGA